VPSLIEVADLVSKSSQPIVLSALSLMAMFRVLCLF
jgi:hypothetical protein